MVGHTHNELDAIFGLLSKFIYGNHANGDSRKNILSFDAFDKVMYERLENYLKVVEDINRVYDFDSFVANYRPSTADQTVNIQRHFRRALHFDTEGTKDGQPEKRKQDRRDESTFNDLSDSSAFGNFRDEHAYERCPGDPPAPVKDSPPVHHL